MVDIAAQPLLAQDDPASPPGRVFGPLSPASISLYASGDLVDGCISYAVGAFAFFYLTVVCGMSGSLAGGALAITIAVDAIMDPLIGFMSDNSRSRWGRRHPFMLLSAVPVAVALGLFFSVPKSISGLSQFAYVLVVLLALRISMSAFTLPYAALGAELSTDYTERSTIVAYRSGFNILGNFAVTILGLWIFLRGPNGLTNRGGYIPFAWGCALLTLAGALVSTLWTRHLRDRLEQVSVESQVSPLRLIAEMRDVFRNRSFRILFFCILTFWAAQGTISVLSLHASKYFWQLPEGAIKSLPLVSFFGLATGIPLGGLILQKVEKRVVSIWGLAFICFLQMAPPLMRIMHLLPEGGLPLWIILGGVLIISGWGVTCVAISFISMLADAADEHELLFGQRREGLYFAGLTFSAKAAIGLGSLVAGVALDMIHFPHDAAQLGGRPIPADAVRDLGLIFGPGAGLVAMLSAVVLVGYRLDAKRYAEIQQELAARKAAG